MPYDGKHNHLIERLLRFADNKDIKKGHANGNRLLSLEVDDPYVGHLLLAFARDLGLHWIIRHKPCVYDALAVPTEFKQSDASPYFYCRKCDTTHIMHTRMGPFPCRSELLDYATEKKTTVIITFAKNQVPGWIIKRVLFLSGIAPDVIRDKILPFYCVYRLNGMKNPLRSKTSTLAVEEDAEDMVS